MLHWLSRLGVGLLFIGFGLQATAHAQTASDRAATERRLEQLKAQIQQDQARLSETAEEEEASQQRLENLGREIALRQELAATYQQRLDQLRGERDSLRTSLLQLNERLDVLKTQYQRRARHAYKYGRLHDVALILAANSINQMLIRVQYLHRFAEQRREKLTAIQQATADLQAQRDELQASQQRTEELLDEVQAERANLRRLQEQRRAVIAELRQQRETLQEEIERKQSAAQALEARIREMIAASEGEGADASRSPAEEAAYAELSASFEENEGALPWPADGVVTEPFGDRVDPVYGTTTRHPGILIATNPRATVRVVFTGEVAAIDFVPGYGQYLVVRHGDYLSVYSNFSDVYVTEGQSLEAGQLLGRAGTEDEPRGAGVFFAVFDKSTGEAVNPRRWLRDP
jgi:septal ring factor EnvC (AmiA/AmiB activator)